MLNYDMTLQGNHITTLSGKQLREAIINAIVHRDYTAPSNVQVEIHDDRIEIWNPGRLLPGITIDDCI